MRLSFCTFAHLFIRLDNFVTFNNDIAGESWLADLMGLWNVGEDDRPLREGSKYEQGKREAEGALRIVDRQWRLV